MRASASVGMSEAQNSPATEAIEEKLALKRAELIAVDREQEALARRRETLVVEIRTYEDAVRLVAEHSPSVPTLITKGAAEAEARRKKPRGLSAHWKKILARLGRRAMTFSYDDVAQAAQAERHKIGRETLRSHILGYVKNGYLDRVADGVFRFTESGAAAASVKYRIEEPPDVGASGGSDKSEGVAGSPHGTLSQGPEVGSTPTTSTFRRELMTSASFPGLAPITGVRS